MMHFGDLSDTVSSLEANATSQAQNAALQYAQDFYDEYTTQIWLTGIAIAGWMIWVSVRSTCEKCKKQEG